MAKRPPPPPTPPTRPPADLLAKLANDQLNARQFMPAARLAREALTHRPDHPVALGVLSLVALERGDLAEAISSLQRAVKAPDAQVFHFSNLAEMLRQAGDLTAAESAGREAVRCNAGYAPAWSNLGIILQERGQFEDSRAALERALKIDPANPLAHNNLGNTLWRLGDRHGAEAHWNSALALLPGYAEPLSNMAQMRLADNDSAGAIGFAELAIARNPRLPDAYVTLAAAHAARHAHETALAVLDRLAAFAPRHAPGLSARAAALRKLDRLPESLASARLAVEIAPANAEARCALGQSLQAMGDSAAALAAFEQAAELGDAGREAAELQRALLLAEVGRQAEALAAFDRLVAVFPHSAVAWFNRADHVRFVAGDPAIDRMLALRSNPSISAVDRMLLDFALGKAFLDAGDSERAFDHLDRGNRSKRATLSYDPAESTRLMQTVAATVTPALLDSLAGQGAPSMLPIFIVGMPRSGSTLLEQMLASHPAISGAGELRFISRLAERVAGYPLGLADASGPQLRRIGEDYLTRVASLARGRAHVIDKMPSNFVHAGLIHLALPQARIIHMRRNAADTCLSCYSKLFQSAQDFTYDQSELGRFYRDYLALMSHWRAVLPPDRFIEIDYESLVTDAEGELRRLLDFIGLPFDAACLRFHETARPVRTASVNQVRQPLYTSSSGRWRAHEARLGPLLAALGDAIQERFSSGHGA